MPEGEEMFKFHGYSGPCPKPPLKRVLTDEEAAWDFAAGLAIALEDVLYTHPMSSRRRGGEGSIVRRAQEDQENAIAKAKDILGRACEKNGFNAALARAKGAS